jgi:hypothetical protein
MKKIVLLVTAIAFSAIPLMAEQKLISTTTEDNKLSLRAGMNIGGNMKTKVTVEDYSDEYEHEVKDASFFVGAQYSLNKQPNSDFGVGADYLFEREEYSIIPVYGYGKLKLGRDFNLVGTLGYNFLSMSDKPSGVKMKNGICYSVGLESQINPDIKLFADYAMYNGGMEMEIDDYYGSYTIEADLAYSTLAFGLSFNLK